MLTNEKSQPTVAEWMKCCGYCVVTVIMDKETRDSIYTFHGLVQHFHVRLKQNAVQL